MNRGFTAEIVLDLEDAEILYKALKVEITHSLGDVDVRLENGKVVLKLVAENLSELRAGVNAWLRTVKACLDSCGNG